MVYKVPICFALSLELYLYSFKDKNEKKKVTFSFTLSRLYKGYKAFKHQEEIVYINFCYLIVITVQIDCSDVPKLYGARISFLEISNEMFAATLADCV
jgi:hypothetical protein